MTARTRALAPLLRTAWLLAGTLALIAGILGMHVLTSSHASHAAASGYPAGHTAVAHSVAAHSAAVQDPASASCGDACPAVHEAGAPCIPLAPTGPVSVPPPPDAPAAFHVQPRDNPSAVYSYSPPGPTPCQLSISRT
ncbi:MAG: hypothetical protein HOQ04_10310 [Pseudarthrobacter sp.]|nr:hypothetical protein [Pseudarthrobacter sp.]